MDLGLRCTFRWVQISCITLASLSMYVMSCMSNNPGCWFPGLLHCCAHWDPKHSPPHGQSNWPSILSPITSAPPNFLSPHAFVVCHLISAGCQAEAWPHAGPGYHLTINQLMCFSPPHDTQEVLWGLALSRSIPLLTPCNIRSWSQFTLSFKLMQDRYKLRVKPYTIGTHEQHDK